MGTHVRTAALMMGLLLVGLSAIAWAAPEEPAANSDPVLEMGVTENAKGVVYFYDERRPEIWVTLGTRHGLHPEAVVAFVRHDEIVAEGIVTNVRNADCVIAPAPGTPAGQVLLGDQVKVLTNGPRVALNSQMSQERRLRMYGTIIVGAWLLLPWVS
ncbi:MAG: hypothetical protein JXA57_05325 [Armatimonadetes bacterium]|nr:hypothetical protein [Armatimonadota bacterium]